VGRGEKVFFLHIPLATKLGTFHWPPSFASTFTSLLLLFKRRIQIIRGFFFSNIIFNSILNTRSNKLLEKEKNDYFWWRGKEGKYNENLVISLKEWK
jgi:hypothetical protein